MTDFRYSSLRFLYSLQPFNFKGDAHLKSQGSLPLSCIIPTFDRWNELDAILSCLSMQNFPKDRFEVIIVEDGATEEGRCCCEKYEKTLNIHLIQSAKSDHCIGALRNIALENCRGEYLLFLDDDTQIFQNNFLQILHDTFVAKPDIGCIQIAGNADRCFIAGKYDYLDKFSFATRCVAYRRKVVARIGGFINTLKSYEDIEMSIRFIVSGGEVFQAANLEYYHPPLYFKSFDKTITNGLAFLTLVNRYSFLLWFVCYLNAIRFLPFLLSLNMKDRQWGKISAGFLIAPFYRLFKGKGLFYR